MYVFLDLQEETTKANDSSMQKSTLEKSEQVCNIENQEINVQPLPSTSKETQSVAQKPLPMDTTSSSAEVEKSMLTIVLDLNGLLLKRSPSPSLHHKSVQLDSKRYIILRPGCIQFLKTVLERFNVAIWSTATRNNVLQILRALEDLAEDVLSFFAIWFQEGCYTAQNQKLFQPDKPNVEASFKPLAKIAMGFECDPKRTVLIDDSPYKGCISPASNCIFPPEFDGEKIIDSMLLGELLPYLLLLDETRDVREFIASNRFGKPAITNDSEYKEIIEYWKAKNDAWSVKVIFTRRIPPVKYDRGEQDKVDQTKDRSHRNETRRAEIKEILQKQGTPVESMKPAQLISLARQLGCSTKATLKATTAKAYINKLKAEHNLLRLDKRHP